MTPTSPFAGISDAAMSAVLSLLLAKEVIVRLVDGAEYIGLFSGTERSVHATEVCIVLRYARVVRPSDYAAVVDLRGTTARVVRVPAARIATLKAGRLDFDAARPMFADGKVGGKHGFVTDAEISRGASGVGRQLKRFDDFNTTADTDRGAGAPVSLDEETFGDLAAMNGSRPGRKWDQFQVNEDKFGVRTSFDEDEYTTKIDRNDANFAERQREAARLASEIEGKASDNIHMREERNQALGADFDEEAMYSGVQRPLPVTAEGRPVAQHQHEDIQGPKPVAVDKPKLSYAAAAASTLSTPSGLTVAGSTKQVTVSKPSQLSKQTPVSKPVTVKQATPKQMNAPRHAPAKQAQTVKSAPGPKQVAATKQAAAPKQPAASKQLPAGKQATAPKQPPSSKTPLAAKQPPAAKHPVAGKQTVSKQPMNTKQQTVQKQTSVSKQGPVTKAPQAPRHPTNAPAGVSAGVAASSTSEKQTSYSSAVSGNITENKEQETVEKKSKPSGVRERSGRENLSQLAKVRKELTGRTSPNQSRNSPLLTPAAPDAVAVLNLDAQTPNLGPEHIKHFQEFKTNRGIRSIQENREKITDEFKKFRTQLDSRNGPLRRGPAGTVANGSSSNAATVLDKKAAESTPKAEETQNIPQKQPEQKPEDPKLQQALSGKAAETLPSVKPKRKSKLNPNAQEFKFNPDAPKFEPSSQKQAPVNSAPPQAFSPYPVGVVPAEYSQAMQSAHQGYAVPVQAMGQIPYGQPPYGVIMPGAIPSGMGPNNSAYQFMPGPPGSFPAAQVSGRFPQSAAMPASYPYPHMNPTVPMVLAPGPQRVPSTPYAYYSSGPYGAAQVPGAPQIPQPPQQPVYAASNQQGLPHVQGGVQMTGRGGHNHPRRGGGVRRGGKHHGQHTHPPANGVNAMEKNVPRTAAADTPAPSEMHQNPR